MFVWQAGTSAGKASSRVARSLLPRPSRRNAESPLKHTASALPSNATPLRRGTGAERTQTFYRLEWWPAGNRAQFQILSASDEQIVGHPGDEATGFLDGARNPILQKLSTADRSYCRGLTELVQVVVVMAAVL